MAEHVSVAFPSPLCGFVTGAVVDDQHVDSVDAANLARNATDDTRHGFFLVQAWDHNQKREACKRRFSRVGS
jgi:hypothetical protein